MGLIFPHVSVPMASILGKLPPPPLFNGARRPLLINLQKVELAASRGRQDRVAVYTKATSDSSESSTALTVFKSVQNVWDSPEDRIGLFGLGFAAVVGLWASANLITAIDKLPLIPTFLEFVGILFSSVSVVSASFRA
ncbi:hypothetical protein M9H77_37279 [Catharanthus roseus]|uniref:Uncharacterized protein n=1 Tax=Catharanthus roseus TaxID=4058 RepID=A0ACB9ZU72_CATRO|nr:hypothetical protein M9H77_37279 [Catharanthus roseus]